MRRDIEIALGIYGPRIRGCSQSHVFEVEGSVGDRRNKTQPGTNPETFDQIAQVSRISERSLQRSTGKGIETGDVITAAACSGTLLQEDKKICRDIAVKVGPQAQVEGPERILLCPETESEQSDVCLGVEEWMGREVSLELSDADIRMQEGA